MLLLNILAHRLRRLRKVASAALLIGIGLLFSQGKAQAQFDDTSLSPSLSGPLADPLTEQTPSTGFSSEVVAGASVFGGASRRSGISDPTGALLENSVRTPNVNGFVNSDPAQAFTSDVNVDAALASSIDVYSGSRAAFQPAFSGTLLGSFRGTARLGAQTIAGSQLGVESHVSSLAFGRGSQLQAFGSTGSGTITATDALGNPVILRPGDLTVYLDPNQVYNSTLVTQAGSVPGLYSYPVAGTPLAIISSDGYGGPGSFSDSTRGTAGSPPEYTPEGRPLFVSSLGSGESPFQSLSGSDSSFLRPTLLMPIRSATRSIPASSTQLTRAQRQARMLALLSGNPQSQGTPAFEQKRTDRLKNMRVHPGERPSRVKLTPTGSQ